MALWLPWLQVVAAIGFLAGYWKRGGLLSLALVQGIYTALGWHAWRGGIQVDAFASPWGGAWGRYEVGATGIFALVTLVLALPTFSQQALAAGRRLGRSAVRSVWLPLGRRSLAVAAAILLGAAVMAGWLARRADIAATPQTVKILLRGQESTSRIVLANTSRAHLRIVAVRSSCSCIEAIPADRELPPHGQTTLTVVAHTAAAKPGHRYTLFVQTTSPRTPTLRLAVETLP